nr:hypothetical protein [Pseudopedobacter sp.]
MKIFNSLVFLLAANIFLSACNTSQQTSNHLKDSLLSTNSSDSTILVYASGLEKISPSLQQEESPVYTKGDYNFYVTIMSKDSLPVIYREFGDSGEYGYIDKTYYLENGELVLYLEKSKQALAGEKPNFQYKQSRIYFRNNVFLKAEERFAESDSLIKQTQFSLVDQNLVDKNKQFDFQTLQDAVHHSGDFNLTFDRIQSAARGKNYLVLSSINSGYESSYQITKPDSIFANIQTNPDAFRGKKINIKYNREGTHMIYKSANLGF